MSSVMFVGGKWGHEAIRFVCRHKLRHFLSRSARGTQRNVLGSAVLRYHSSFCRKNLLCTKKFLILTESQTAALVPRRFFVGAVVSGIARNLLKLRYWIIGGTVGGGIVLGQRYEEWKQSLPDTSWIGELFESSNFKDMRSRWSDSMTSFSSSAKDLSESAGEFVSSKRLQVSDWLEELLAQKRLEEAEAVAATSQSEALAEQAADSASGESFSRLSDEGRIQRLRDELLELQAKYQRELETVERENKDLRRQLLIKTEQTGVKRRKVKESLIDMYSQVLDSLQRYDCSYNVQDNLPRVVVVGDQSSGKTSVLEMIAKARMFPRGAGEMMTRAPVKVTLSEGPYHLAQFKDSKREFDLTKETDLEQLRKEIEVRMKNSVKAGKTVSSEVIGLTVKGPGLPRMVLVDLPGIISTVTTDMAKETKDDIARMCKTYMENPNAIILCIQDGSVDAERSNVTDLVSSMDRDGRRTILVLTKVDLAEENLANPQRIKKILEGKLFPMKALGYYAVVTGRGNTKDSIETIRKYEENFFSKSRLFKDGVLKPSQMTTANMSMAVSSCFWKMVKESVEQQADAFRAARYNLETEWKNNFPRLRQLDRDEVYDKARGEILDEIVSLSQLDAQDWESSLQKELWSKVSSYVYENIYLPAALVDSAGKYNTLVDIRLKHWADVELPNKCVVVGWETLKRKFLDMVAADAKTRSDHDALFDPLKHQVLEEAMQNHQWDVKALDYLRVIQLNALEDRSVPNKAAWDGAIRFMESAVKARLEETQKALAEMKGPSLLEQWVQWRAPTEDMTLHREIHSQLCSILQRQDDHGAALREDDLTVVRRHLEEKGFSHVGDEVVRNVWHVLYREHFLQKAHQASKECRSFYYHYKEGFSDAEVDCQAVVLFWRVQRMLQLTANALRQQITNSEQRRLEKEIKDVLEDWSQDSEMKKKLLTGRRVDLAEELKKVRDIQEKLEEFVEALKTQKS